MNSYRQSILLATKKSLLETFSILDVLLVSVLVLSLTYCTKSPGIVKPESKYSSTLSEGILFSRDGNPQFVKRITGLAGREYWGRWSNQDEVLIEFADPLPPKQYIFQIEAKGFGKNIGVNTQMMIGSDTFNILLQSSPKKFSFPVEIRAPINQIKIEPAAPTTPNSLDPNNSDVRRLGIGLIELRIM